MLTTPLNLDLVAPQTASSHQEAFDLLARLAENRLGMDFHKRRHDRLFLMIGKRVKATFKKSILDYLSFLETNPNHPEWIEIEQILTIQKTEFFRESSQMKFFEETILPEIKHRKFKERDSKVRAWSCGCSTGEEAYTLSILFHQRFLPSTDWDVRILASDVHQNALEIGQNAEYTEESLQNVSKENKLSYFEKIGQNYCVIEPLKEMIQFRKINLISDSYPIKTKFSVIFCRNLLIYMTPFWQNTIVNRLRNYLEPGGYLLLGHSEYLADKKDFQLTKFNAFQSPIS
ncbi:MAG: CheR family methyltransferase [bacterium]|jgi:chemotaxis protein methyltransferase CheR